MASRRLDISSLLCNDETTEPVVLGSHLKHPTQSSIPSYTRHVSSPATSSPFPPQSQMLHAQPVSSSSQCRPSRKLHSPTPNLYPLPVPSIPSPHRYPSPASAVTPKLPSFGLEALVQAATEERRRLSGSTSTLPDIPEHTSPSVEQRHNSQPQQYHHPQNFRQRKASEDHIRSPILSPSQAIHSPVQPIRSPMSNGVDRSHIQPTVYSPLLQQQPQLRHRAPDRHRPLFDESQPQRSAAEDVSYRLPPTVYFSPVSQHQQPRHSIEHEHRLQHQHELQRQRFHHEQLLLQEQHQQRRSLERQIVYPEKGSVPPSSWGPPIALYADTPPQPHNRSSVTSFQTSGRKSDPGQPHRVVTPTHAEPLPPPIISTSEPIPSSSLTGKRRRYSDSPVHTFSTQDQVHYREREEMITGSLGYGRLESSAPINGSESRGPVSGRGQSRKLGLAEIMTAEHASDHSHNSGSSRLVVDFSRERPLPSPYPQGRRSPPGSQVGRAIAARKSEEMEHSVQGMIAQTSSKFVPVAEGGQKQPPRSRQTSEAPMVSDPHITSPLPAKAGAAQAGAAEDAHEWFLEHFDDDNAAPVPQSSAPRISPSPAATPVPAQRASASPLPDKQTPTPTTMPEAAAALEQELDELLGDPSGQASKVEPDMTDMDVDLAITELVAGTLETEDAKVEDVGMEIDVEDELLSLVDGRRTVRRPAKSVTPAGSTAKPPPDLQTSLNTVKRTSSPTVPTMLALSPAEIPLVIPSTQPTSERGSIPPPSFTLSREEEEKAMEAPDGAPIVPSKKKKKDTAPKTGSKSRMTTTSNAAAPNAKVRAKSGPKSKPKTLDTPQVNAIKVKGSLGPKKLTLSRSRSTSVMPGLDATETKAEKQEEEEESDNQEDDKLYCVCKTKYDEDRFMIACDRCDEWYHTQCVNMPDLEVDLVDQFICPTCIEKNPHLSLRTTYKPRCLYGLRNPDSESSKACHKPARGVFSKYCSDECGVKYMQSRADAWAKKGGKKEKLWEIVKDAEKREGVVVCAGDKNSVKTDVNEERTRGKDMTLRLKNAKIERDVEQLNKLLGSIVKLREELKKGMECVVWREKLLELATERAEQIGECGWDQRLCFGDEEWADFGTDALESYDEVKGENGAEGGAEWWCPGKKVCERHAGWQAVRHRDITKEKEKKKDALSNLTTREREIRKRIEDILDPHGRNCNESPLKSPLRASNGKLPNGHTKRKTNVDVTKKGKKRKAPS